MKRMVTILAGGLLLAATACGSSAGAPPAGNGANTLVCRHYLAQRAWVKGLAFPTLAEAAKFAGYVGADDGQAQPGTKLRRDLDAMVTAIQAHQADYAA